MKTIFLRVLEAEDKAAALLEAVRESVRADGRQRFEVDPRNFTSVPRSPFSYWVSERLRSLFVQFLPFEGDGRVARVGLQTSDDSRFVRTWWETEKGGTGARWFGFAKGGGFSPFYAELALVANWECGGSEMKAFAETTPGTTHWSRNLRNTDLYARAGLTWPLRAARFAPHALAAGSVFSVRGYCVFVPEGELASTLAIFNSSTFDYLFKTALGRFGFPEFIVGVLQTLPWVGPRNDEERATLGAEAHRAWSLRRRLDTRSEVSHSFTLPALLQVDGADVCTCAAAWLDHVHTLEAEFAKIQAAVDERCFALYGIDEADRRAITEGFGSSATEAESSGETDEVEADGAEDNEEDDAAADATILVAELVSWAVGVAFGRFDVRFANGTALLRAEPGPFDPLPACSPGMLTGDDGMPLDRAPADYPLGFPETGVLVDDLGHAQDIMAAMRGVFDVVFGADTDRWCHDVAAILDPKGHDLRTWLTDSFFEHHLKRYSKSRRKAPILWQLSTPSGRYGVWLYAHRLTRDTFFQLQNEVVGPKLAHEERQLTSLTQNAGGSPSASERKGIAAQEAFVEELRTMLDEVKRVAPLWNPNLDDGVVLTMAPLWRLVPQHKPWQRELKAKWSELAAAKYDWAHLAMHLWPERVVPRCATDRSLAIAHGLENEFWVQSFDGKWKSRATPLESVEDLVRARSSPAVKAALNDLVNAPAAGANKRTRMKKTDA